MELFPNWNWALSSEHELGEEEGGDIAAATFYFIGFLLTLVVSRLSNGTKVKPLLNWNWAIPKTQHKASEVLGPT